MFDQNDNPLIMAILNVTPDSFSDGGRFETVSAAVRQVRSMVEQGADIIDIGGESTRPGADPVPVQVQMSRVLPVIEAIRKEMDEAVQISIDTTQAEVAGAALQAGANWINDVSAGEDDDEMFGLAALWQVPIVMMHRQGISKTMQNNPYYDDVVREVLESLSVRIRVAMDAGIRSDRIIIDPGIGFGKRKHDNFDLLAHLDEFVALGFPVLLGASRKRFMGALCQVEEPSELVTATAVTTALGVMAGVRIFRVHDVKENRQAADVAFAIKGRL